MSPEYLMLYVTRYCSGDSWSEEGYWIKRYVNRLEELRNLWRKTRLRFCSKAGHRLILQRKDELLNYIEEIRKDPMRSQAGEDEILMIDRYLRKLPPAGKPEPTGQITQTSEPYKLEPVEA